MSTISSKEKRILLIGAVVVLYGIAFVCYKTQMPNWTRERNVYQTAEKKLQTERALIAARTEWLDKYEEVRERMPTFSDEQDMNTHWWRIIDKIAEDVNLVFTRRPAASKEIEVGGVYELPVEYKNWEGSLESLVKFLYALSIQEGAMLDVRQLFINTTAKPGALKGSITIYCAYMRGN